MRTVRNSSCLLDRGSPPPGSRHPPRSRHPPWEQAPPGDLLQGMLGYHPPWRLAARHAGRPPTRHAGIPPPCRQTHTCKNITFATSLRTAIKYLAKPSNLVQVWCLISITNASWLKFICQVTVTLAVSFHWSLSLNSVNGSSPAYFLLRNNMTELL